MIEKRRVTNEIKEYNIEWYCLSSDLKGMKNSPLAGAYNLGRNFVFFRGRSGKDGSCRDLRGDEVLRHYLHCVINEINHV